MTGKEFSLFVKTREISFTTGIPEIDRRTENRIRNASIVLIFGTDIEGMRTFLRRHICGRTARMSGDRPDGRPGKEKNEAVFSFGADGFVRPFGLSEKSVFRIQDIRRAAENDRRTADNGVRTIVIDPEKQDEPEERKTKNGRDRETDGGEKEDGEKKDGEKENDKKKNGVRESGGIAAAVREILNGAAERDEKMIAVFVLFGSAAQLFGCGGENDRRRQKTTTDIRLSAETVLEFRIEENGGAIERYIIVHRLSAGDPIDRKIGYIIGNGEIVIEQTKRVY